MIAFVLSGAGNRGPLEVGALKALAEHGLQPDFIVGTSAGAINGCYVASRGLSLETLEAVHQQWHRATTKLIYPGNIVTAAWRVLRKQNSLYPNDGIRRLIREGLPAHINTFADLTMPLYVTAVDLISSKLFIFGEDPSVELVEPILASSCIPIIHPPVDYHGLQLVDGGVLANVAASFAMDKGATTIYVVNAGYGGEPQLPVRGIIEVATRSVVTMMGQSIHRDLERASADDTVDLHHIHLNAYRNISFRDFSKTDEMVATGYQMTQEYLAAPSPRIVAPMPSTAPALGATVPGAREYYPPYTIRF
jgi:NTE family protein